MEKTLQDKLRIVAEFDGYKVVPVGTKTMGEISLPEISEGFLKYNTSYDWLIPVWVKFRDMAAKLIGGPDFKMHEHLCKILRVEITASSKEDAFENIVEAIKWYNSLGKLATHQ